MFRFAFDVYSKAASGEMVGSHLPKPDPGKPGLYLSNIPINRGMMAVMRETQHITDDERQSLCLRLMHFGEAMELARADSRLADHLKPDGEMFLVSRPFVDAYAQCHFHMSQEDLLPDLDDLFQRAQAIRAFEDAEDAARSAEPGDHPSS